MARDMKDVLRQIRADCERDATELDGMPFDGKTMAKAFGNTLGMIASLARVMEEAIRNDEE